MTYKIIKTSNCKKIVVSKEIKKQDQYLNYLYSQGLDIVDGKWLFQILSNMSLEYICKKNNLLKSEISISILANQVTENVIYFLKKIVKEYKRINIVTNNINLFKNLETQIMEQYGVMIVVTNNKRKSLSKSQLIVNFDFPTELINKYNIFLYVDPFGIKDIDFNIFKLLASNNKSSELLLNLNSFGFIREGCRNLKVAIDEDIEVSAGDYEESSGNDIQNMNKIANGSEWQQIVSEIGKTINGKKAERLFVELYLKKLGEIFRYVFAVPIRTRDTLVPKYQIIFATNHHHGAFIMLDTMLKCDVEMTRNGQNGQMSLFDYENTKSNINTEILSLLDRDKWINCRDLCFKLFNKYKIYFIKDVRAAIKELEKEGKIIVDRHNKTTKTGQQSLALDFVKSDINLKRN